LDTFHLDTLYRANILDSAKSSLTSEELSRKMVRSIEHFRQGKIKRDRTSSSTFLPYMKNPVNCFSTILVYYNINTIHLPPTKTCSNLRMVKDSLGPEVYKILCECGQFCTWEMDHMKEHQTDLQLYHPVHSAVAEHSTDQGYGYTLETPWH
jgi:hypothetical protein